MIGKLLNMFQRFIISKWISELADSGDSTFSYRCAHSCFSPLISLYLQLGSTGGALEEVKIGVMRLAQVILGASHLAQGVIPAVLSPASKEDSMQIKEWKLNLCATLEQQSTFSFERLGTCHGLSANRSNGAMYTMVKIDTDKLTIQNDIDFSRKLLEEENVVTLPGTPFGAPNYFRLVFCASTAVLDEAFRRIQDFCSRYAA